MIFYGGFMEKSVTGIILVAGNSTRYGLDRNKNFELLDDNNTVLDYSLDVFFKSERIDDIIVVAREDEFLDVVSIIDKHGINKPISVTVGGNTRKNSVYNALIKTNSDIVIIHDGARPFIKEEYIDKCIESMEHFFGATIGVKAKDTIKICDNNGVVVNTTKRDNTWLIQTPQCFNRNVLLSTHIKYKNDNSVTDDCMLLEKAGFRVKVIEGDYSNIKLTTYDDMEYLKSKVKVLKNKD